MFNDVLKEQLEANHIRKRSIAYNTGIATKRFIEIENGAYPTREELSSIADYLKMDLDEDKIKEYTGENKPEETETKSEPVETSKPGFTEDDVLRNLKEIRSYFNISQASLAHMVNKQNKNFKLAGGQISVYERTRKGLAEKYKRPIYRVFCSPLYKTETKKIIDDIKNSSTKFDVDEIFDNIGFIINYLHIDENKLVSAIRLKHPDMSISIFDILSAEESKVCRLNDEQKLAIYMYIVNTYSLGQINAALYNGIYYKKENQLSVTEEDDNSHICLSKEDLNNNDIVREEDKSSDTPISDIISESLDRYDGPTKYTKESLGETILKYGTVSTCTSVDSVLRFLNKVDAGIVGPKEELISIIKRKPTDFAKLILELDEVKSYLISTLTINYHKNPETPDSFVDNGDDDSTNQE